jgi:hypothetical protein
MPRRINETECTCTIGYKDFDLFEWTQNPHSILLIILCLKVILALLANFEAKPAGKREKCINMYQNKMYFPFPFPLAVRVTEGTSLLLCPRKK